MNISGFSTSYLKKYVNPLTFTAQKAGSTIKLNKHGSPVIDRSSI